MPSSTLQLIQATEPKYMAQVLAAVAVSLGPFASGLGKGYSSPALASLQKPWSNVTGAASILSPSPSSSSAWDNFSVSQQEGSWIASLSLLGALFGGPMGGFLIRYGRKRTLLSVSLPFAGCWLLTVFASCVAMMYVTAFACGFCSALVLLVTHVYISEIAAPEIRGGLCALAKTASHIGLLVSFTLGAYLDWRRLAMVAATAPAMLFIAAWYVPETPSYLLLRGRESDASAALQWLRGGAQVDISTELLTIQANLQEKHARTVHQRSLCHQRRLYKPILITCGTMVFQRLSGAHAFSFYAVPIFRATFKDMDPHAAAIVVGFFQLFGAVTSGLLVDTIGRLPLLVASNFFMAVALGAFGTFVYWHGSIALDGSTALLAPPRGVLPVLPVSENVDWIPLVCVIIFTIAFSIGVGPIAWLLISELFPLEYRGLGGAIATSFSYACAFVSVKTFVDFEATLGLHGAFWLYAVVSFLGLVFVLTCVPETRGKGLDEMEFKMVVRH